MSDFQPNTQFSCDNRIGITFIAQSAFLSCAAVLSLLIYVTYNAIRNRHTARWVFLRSHVDLYFLGLLISDLIQSIGGIMDIRWITKAGVYEGRFCTAQGALEQLGDVGVALCSLAIASHTFAVLVLRWKEPKSWTIPIVVLCIYAIFLALIVGVGYATHQHSVYYGNTTYWCWIKRDFLKLGIGLEYLWLWIAALVNLVVYIPIFLVLKHIITVEPTEAWYGYKVKRMIREERAETPTPEHEEAIVHARRMLYYPAAYIVTVLPIGLVRIRALTDNSVPFPATVFSGVLFSASGLFNVLVFTFTRPTLLRPNAPLEPRRPPKGIFMHNSQHSDDGTSEDASPRLADDAFEMEPRRESDVRSHTE